MHNINRRGFLKGALYSAGGLVLGTSTLARAAEGFAVAKPTDVHLLTSDAAADASFGAGVQLGLPIYQSVTRHQAGTMELLGTMNRLLQQQRPMRLIGLVDDASAELLTATARRLGARMSWLARHSADRHQVRHSAIEGDTSQFDGASQLWAVHLGHQLAGARNSNSLNLPQSLRLEGRFVSFVIEV